MNKPSTHDVLFSEFEKKSKKDWISIVKEDIKGADDTKKPGWHTMEGFLIDPLYTLEETSHLAYLKNYHNLLPDLPKNPESPRCWHYVEKIRVVNEKKANLMACETLKMGADGIHFTLPDPKRIDFNRLIHQLSPNINPVSFHLKNSPANRVEAYLNYLSRRSDVPLEEIIGWINYDPFRDFSLSGSMDETGFDSLASCIRCSENVPLFKVLTIHGDQFLNAGSDMAHEIAFTLNIMVEYLDHLTEKGIPLQQVIQNLRISIATGSNYFMEIAKIKVLRILFRYILSAYGIKLSLGDEPWIHCDTSLWTKTIYDPHVNMMRNTTEAMAAILGGANSLSIIPFDAVFSEASDLSRRISRNISNLLKKEAYFNKVIDPSAGSYYIETLMDRLIEQSLEIFKETESEGGYLKAFEKGLIQQKIAAIRDKKYDLLSHREMVIVGTNQYANPEEKIKPEEIAWKNLDFPRSDHHLIPARASYHFDKLRLNTELYVKKNGENKRPRVFLSLMGDHTVMGKTRSAFAEGFFGCAGFSIKESSPSSSIFKSIQKAIDSHADIVVMCGSDEDYIKSGTDYAKAFKANHQGLLVVAGNPAGVKEELLSAGVDDFIHLNTNVIDSLRQFQIRLKILKRK
jgi:methylmalonyl-CoA mutase